MTHDTQKTLVQAIAVRPAGHLETCAAAAAASGLALLGSSPDDPRWNDWLASAFTKTVRSAARQAKWNRLLAAAQRLGLEHAVATVGQAQAVAFAPMAYEDMPRELRSLQVSGIDEPVGPPAPTPRADPARRLLVPEVRLDPSVAMTTGKAAAQTAHAVCLWLLTSSNNVLGRWAARPEVDVRLMAEDRPAVIEIKDNGLTEVEPGTRTATVQCPPVNETNDEGDRS